MATPVSTNATWRFGAYEVDTRRVELRRDCVPVKIREQLFLILVYLLEHAGEIVTREELRRVLWPSDTFVDVDHSLNMAVMNLRSVLDDSTEAPIYIETIPKRGYRFIAPVGAVDNNLVCTAETAKDTKINLAAGAASGENGLEDGKRRPVSETATVAATTQPSFSEHWIWAIVVFTAIISLLAAAIWFVTRPLPPPQITDIVQITHDGYEKETAGTDGIRIYFTRAVPSSIAQVVVASGDIAQVGVAGGDIAQVPVGLPTPRLTDVSPNGSNLLVSSENGGKYSLWSVEIPGGALRRLVPDGVFGAWSPDGKSLISRTLNEDIVAMRSDGTGAHIVVPAKLLAEHSKIFDFAWSPDGSRIRLSASSSTGTRSRLFEMSPDGSGLHELLPGWHPLSWRCCGRWTPDGKLYLFASGDFDTQGAQIWVIDERRNSFRTSPTEPVQLTQGPIRWGQPIPGKDGKKIFVTGNILRGELVRYDAQSHQFQPFLRGISAEGVTFSPDGRLVAYVTFPEGILWGANRDGSKPVHLTDPPIYPRMPRWSPDGNQILFFGSDSEGLSKAYVISTFGETPQPILQTTREYRRIRTGLPTDTGLFLRRDLGQAKRAIYGFSISPATS